MLSQEYGAEKRSEETSGESESWMHWVLTAQFYWCFLRYMFGYGRKKAKAHESLDPASKLGNRLSQLYTVTIHSFHFRSKLIWLLKENASWKTQCFRAALWLSADDDPSRAPEQGTCIITPCKPFFPYVLCPTAPHLQNGVHLQTRSTAWFVISSGWWNTNALM